jgi:hypothetical protein
MPRGSWSEKSELASRWVRDHLTRRGAWMVIAFIIVWNVALGGLLVWMMLRDGFSVLAFLPNLIIGLPLLVGMIWWLFEQTRPSSDLPSEFGGAAGPLLPAQQRRPAPARLPSDMCRLCGLSLRPTEELVRLHGELFHVVCAEPAMSHTPAWRQRELGTLNQLTEGIGRSTVL